MKKFAFLMSMMLISVFMIAQNPVSSAAAEYKQAEFNPLKIIDAKKNIDKAIESESSAKDARAWYIRGIVYKRLHEIAHLTENIKVGMPEAEVNTFLNEPESTRNYRKIEEGVKNVYVFGLTVYFSKGVVHSYEFDNEEVLAKADDGFDALDIAYKSFQKSIAIDPDYIGNPQHVSRTANQGIQRVAQAYFNNGIIQLKAGVNETALGEFERAMNCYKVSGSRRNANLVYYAGIAASYTGSDDEKAIQYLSEAQQMGIKESLLFNRLSEHYKAKEQYDKAIEVVQKGRELYPEDQGLLIVETNIYLKIGEPEKAIELLNMAIKADPTNAKFHYAVGTNYDGLTEDTTITEEQRKLYFNKAIESYKSAIKIDSTYKDAIFNLGVLYYNEGANWFKLATNLPLNDPKYDEYIANGNESFKKSLPFMEKYHKLDPKDKSAMRTLAIIYQKLKMVTELRAIRALMAD